MITSHHYDSSPATIICPLVSWKSVLMAFIAVCFQRNIQIDLIKTKSAYVSPLLKLQWLFILLRSKKMRIWVLIPSTTSPLFILLVHASLTSPSLLNKLGSSLPYGLCSSISPYLGFSASILSLNSCLPHLPVLLHSLLCPHILSLLLCFAFFSFIMPIILKYTIAYNLLFFSLTDIFAAAPDNVGWINERMNGWKPYEVKTKQYFFLPSISWHSIGIQ